MQAAWSAREAEPGHLREDGREEEGRAHRGPPQPLPIPQRGLPKRRAARCVLRAQPPFLARGSRDNGEVPRREAGEAGAAQV